MRPFDQLFGEHLHKNSNPWRDAPAWGVELFLQGALILEKVEKDMSAVQDLNNAITALTNGFATLDAAVNAQLAVIAAAPPDDSAAIQGAVANIALITGKMSSDAAALTAALPAATTVAPTTVTPPSTTATATVTPPAIAPVTVTDPNATPPTA